MKHLERPCEAVSHGRRKGIEFLWAVQGNHHHGGRIWGVGRVMRDFYMLEDEPFIRVWNIHRGYIMGRLSIGGVLVI